MSSNEPIREYDSNRRLIHYKDSDGYECWHKYDSNGKIIYYKNSNGLEWWYEYDSNGNCIYYTDNSGYERWYWEGKETLDPIKILILETQLHSKVTQ